MEALLSKGFVLPLVFLGGFFEKIISGDEEAQGILATFIVAAVIVYIIAIIMSKKTNCIIIYGWKDLLLVIAPEIIIVFIVLYNVIYGSANNKIISADNITANTVFVIPFVLSTLMSISANLRHSSLPQSIIYMAVSIIIKPIMMVVMVVFVVLFLCSLNAASVQTERDKRYKSGWKPGKYEWLIPIILALGSFLATFLVGNMIKDPDDMGYINEAGRKSKFVQSAPGFSNSVRSRNFVEPNKSDKNWWTLLILCLLLGWLGVHRFYTKKYFSGLLMLLTMGGFCIWWLIDFIFIATGEYKDKMGDIVRRK